MRKFFILLFTIVFAPSLFAQSGNRVSLSFFNDRPDSFHLALFFVRPDGVKLSRISDLKPLETKSFDAPDSTQVYVLDLRQEALLSKGYQTLVEPFLVLHPADNRRTIKVSSLPVPQSIPVKPEDALGTWQIDLRPTPESEPYLKEFKFTRIEGNRFDGEFYGYPFSGGFLNTAWGKICFGFTTQDQSGTYYHSGYIENGTVHGITLNEAREFVLPWTGKKK